MSIAAVTCRDLVELVTDYLEGALSESDRVRFEAHLASCQGCTAFVEQMRRTVELTGRLTEGDVPVPARERLLEAFRDWASS